jgi:hypothetical protein
LNWKGLKYGFCGKYVSTEAGVLALVELTKTRFQRASRGNPTNDPHPPKAGNLAEELMSLFIFAEKVAETLSSQVM